MLRHLKYYLIHQFPGKKMILLFVTGFLLFLWNHVVALSQQPSQEGFFRQKAQHFLRSNHPDSALNYFRKFATKALQQKNEQAYLTTRLQMVGCFLRMGENDSALLINKSVLRISREKGYRQLEIISENSLGQLAARETRHEDALKHFAAALALARQLKDKHAMAFSYLNMGNILTKYGLYDQAGGAYRHALQLSSEAGKTAFKSTIYRQLAFVLNKIGKKDSARLLLQKLHNSSVDGRHEEQLTHNYLSQAHYFRETGNIKKATEYYHRAFSMAEKAGLYLVQGDALQSLAEIQRQAGKLNEAVQTANRALRLAKQHPGNYHYPGLYNILFRAWKQKGNVDSALFYHEKLSDALQAVYQKKQQENLDNLRVKYQTDLTQKQLLKLKNKTLEKDVRLKNREIQVNTLLGGSFTLILILALLAVFYFYRQKKNKEMRQQEREKLRLEKEAVAAQALVMGEEKERHRIAQELHDGIGVLLSSASIFFSNIEEQPEMENREMIQKARRLLEQAGTEVRRISHNMMPVVLTRFGLKAALEDMFDDFSEKGQLKIKVKILLPKRLDEHVEIMIYRIVQELLNNTLKHSKASEVRFLFRLHDETFYLDYEDNGTGFDIEKVSGTTGMGMSGIRSRVEFLRGTFNLQTSPGHGFTVKITFPIL